jgi:2-polyprenyl-6-hydroxyphenyl methylase/3-demethylubiquinone-9 3-methyltransferase
MFIKPREMKALLRESRLGWREHRGMKPSGSLPTVLRSLRRRAAGESSYGELGEKLRMAESRITAIMYLGYAVKQ